MDDLYGQIRGLAQRYIDQSISIDDFRAAFAVLYFHARQSSKSDARANSLASKIIGPLAEFSRGHRGEASLREDIGNSIGSAMPTRVYVSMKVYPQFAETSTVTPITMPPLVCVP